MGILTPREIVNELDKYIIGQSEAKKSVAIALRNRWRRQQVAENMKDEIVPKNIIMIGPTGVGKTEIARRLAKLANAPFIKVEATKYTEVGYVGKDVESMIRDLMEVAVSLLKSEEEAIVKEKAKEAAESRILDLLLPAPQIGKNNDPSGEQQNKVTFDNTREKLRVLLKEGKLDHREVEVESKEKMFPSIEIFSPQGMEEMDINIKEMFGNVFPKKTKLRKLKIPDAIKYLTHEEASKLIDMDKVVNSAKKKS